ncbi:MAG: hypothetical protein HGB26_06135 [Desulfobulbaceae bacterium]|nr:hypothetical protein [Desulfobulbaceae bacterium]
MIELKNTPEEIELNQKRELLKQKQSELAELELALSTLQANMHSFEAEYYIKVGVKYVELDRLQAILDKIIASKSPFDQEAMNKAANSKERAERSARNAKEFEEDYDENKAKVQITPELRTIYIELAKLLHPDLILDPIEKERRHHLMQQINQYYQSGNLNKLREILEAEMFSPHKIEGDDIGSSIVRIIREIAQIDKRIAVLKNELDELQKTDLHVLYEEFNDQMEKGNDLLEMLSDQLSSKILCLKEKIEKLNN